MRIAAAVLSDLLGNVRPDLDEASELASRELERFIVSVEKDLSTERMVRSLKSTS
jgi:hypothetical protein